MLVKFGGHSSSKSPGALQTPERVHKEHKLRFLIVKSGRFGYDNGPLDPPSDPNLYSTNIQSTRETIRYDQEET